MLKPLSPVFALALLAGCTSNNSEQYHLQTLSAITNSQAATENRITNLELAINNQNDYIESLETEVLALNHSIEGMKTNHLLESPDSAETPPPLTSVDHAT